jgi:hypothetical protein
LKDCRGTELSRRCALSSGLHVDTVKQDFESIEIEKGSYRACEVAG